MRHRHAYAPDRGQGADLSGHECVFNEVEIEEAEGDENLRAGMKVLVPCVCGETPMDYLGVLTMERDQSDAALLSSAPRRMMYHWAPAVRHKQIQRYGLRPKMRATTNSGRYPVICFADSPSWAWALSGGMPHTPNDCWWDLWETTLDLIQDPVVLPNPDRGSGIQEVRTEHRVYKRNLWYVASRFKGPSSGPDGR